MAGNRPLPSSFDDDPGFYEESRWQKFSRKLKQEPLVPLGALLTCMALVGATRAMRRGDRERTNLMFRRRLYGQAFTLVAMVVGSMYWAEDQSKRKEYRKVVKEKEAQEKREKWIRELELRDEEEKAFKERMARRRKGEPEVPVSSVVDAVKERTQDAKDVAKKAVGAGENEKRQNEQASVLEEKDKNGTGVLAAVKDLVAGKKS